MLPDILKDHTAAAALEAALPNAITAGHVALAVEAAVVASGGRRTFALTVDADVVLSSVAGLIREALDASPDGLTRDQIRSLFQHHVRSERIDAALEQLTTLGTITSQKSRGRGRPSTLWSATEAPETEPE